METKTIFVSIASYRDRLCHETINSLFHHAKYPSNIYVGICQQNKTELKEEDCVVVDSSFNHFGNNIRLLTVSYQEAKGPTYARFLCSLLYKGEDFFLQIDSHSLFVQDWDQKCIEMIIQLEKQGVKKPILSHYPASFDHYKENPSKTSMVPHIIHTFVNPQGIISFKGALMKKPKSSPTKTYYIAGGFLFSRGMLLNEVPFDPFLPNLFVGEEILLTVRAFTSGYDVYTPNQNIVYHYYTRKKEPKFWDDHKNMNTKDVILKTKIILGLENDKEKIATDSIKSSIQHYGLGTERSLEEFYKETGIQVKKNIESFCTLDNIHNQNSSAIILVFCMVLIFFFFLFLVVCLLRFSL